ncbi:lysophospholipase L1-like esterase [Paenibacillus sp. V4I9]|uniref:rhamnogalacturonan acetylesterase n=1 Tax=Paenibacillus sp. V4I9 TaxID=3042308 RepID=UPI00277D4E1A|nr:GDSL-type esterase/lipase family protein [Paenibacillus sp. V4I9]MDQ0888613.1 lysophospholipase L1-like esterase [Paenibacillus sp. V4I9]
MKKVLLTVLTVVLCLSFMIGGSVSASTPTVYKFNFGAGSEVPGDYIQVNASEAYTPDKGYGFNTPQDVINVAASGTGVGSTAVQFVKYGVTSANTFNVDLDKGLYQVQVMLGDTSRSSVAAEGVYQLLNLTGITPEDSFLIPITDGQLNLIVTAGIEGNAHTIAALIITKVSKYPVMPRTVWIGGDSTVANYYPKDADELVGWGQIITELVNPETFQVRNMASAGQIAKGFLEGGSLDTILKYIKRGDYFLFEMGINDEKKYSEGQFTIYMRQIVEAMKAKGATVVLVPPQGRAISWTTDGVNLVHYAEDDSYRHATIALSQEQNVGLVDLNVLSSAYFTSIGPAETDLLYKTGDWLHFNRKGATVLAKLVVQDLQKQGMDGFDYLISF